jgi:hypothetical protein
MNIGFVVKNLGNSEMSHDLIKTIGKISDESNRITPYIFFQDLIPSVMTPYCMTMNSTGLSSFTGDVVAIDIESAMVLYNNISNTDNWIYFYNIHWLNAVVNFELCSKVLENFKIVARSESHKKIIRNFTGRDDIYIAKDMNGLFECLTS